MLLNLIYGIVLLALTPWLFYRALTTRRYRRGLAAKLLGRVEHPLLLLPSPARSASEGRPSLALRAGDSSGAANIVWFHGVSVGEIHLLRPLIARFRQSLPQYTCVVSATTDTGYAEACKHFPDLAVIYWPFDFTWAVKRALWRVNPRLVVLAEGELWPNFLQVARRLGVRTAVVNGRMSPRSAARFQRLRWLVRPLFARVDLIAAQNLEFAEHYRTLGATNVVTTGNIKYDGVRTDRGNPRTRELAHLLGIAADDLVWVVGSTQEPEEAVALDIYRRLQHPRLRLIVVPRHPERFGDVARLLQDTGVPWVRRSTLTTEVPARAVVLVDTMGELDAVWGLADIAYVGGSLDGKRGGQNMIEPAAYGAAVLFGPHTWNFRQTVQHLLQHGGAIQVEDAAALERAVHVLVEDAEMRQQLGQAARQFVLSQQGATAATVAKLECLLPARGLAVAG